MITGEHAGSPKQINLPQRKSIRLKGYDYSQAGLYFITICIQNREMLFGKINNDKLQLNDAGKMVAEIWNEIPNRFTNIKLYEYVIMPNHFHCIIQIVPVGATLVVALNEKTVAHNKNVVIPNEKGQPQGIAPTKKTVGNVIGAFKSITTNEYIRGVKNKNWYPFNKKLWQRNYWDHIIRNEKSFYNISEYIKNNPKNWNKDKLFME